MTPRSVYAVLRTLADTTLSVSDADLLRRFQANDERAFAELVKRYGRLVWTVCRSLTRSDADADDAFQATFLVLLENARKVRDGGKLSAWLHGVAYKVCAKARQSAQQTEFAQTRYRRARGNLFRSSGFGVGSRLTAVHEEVAKLPETLRVPFVLCCLEGRGTTEAAERLGWKLGTLSGRLTRAKDAVLARLQKRGLTLGVVASVGGSAVPTAVAAKAEALAQVGFPVPGSIRQLSQGVIGMSITSVKVLAATVVLTCGLGMSIGAGWLSRADAQQQVVIDEQRQLLEALTQLEVDRKPDTATFKTAKNEYDLIVVSDVSQSKFRKLLGDYEQRGWEYCGTTPLSDPKQLVWVFRRPVKPLHATVNDAGIIQKGMSDMSRTLGDRFSGQVIDRVSGNGKVEDAKSIEAEIARLTEKLAEVRKVEARQMEVRFDKTSSPLDPAVLASVLADLGQKKFGKGGKFNVAHVNGVVTVFGDKEVTEWATGVVKALSGR